MKSTGSSNAARLPLRPFGESGESLSIIGFGGIVVMQSEPEQARRVVAESVERGVNYFDVAPGYGDAEEKLGPALEPYRKGVFLACKTGRRDRAGAEEELRRSMERLRTDHFDLYQLHAISDVERDVDAAFAKGGVMELLDAARRDGRVRHVGFSAHTTAAAVAAMDRYDFDSVLFPVNFAAWKKGDFGPEILSRARDRGVARLALKAMARQHWTPEDPERKNYAKCWYEPLTDRDEAALGLRFTLSRDVTAAIPPGDERLFRMALDLAMELQPLEIEDETQLAAMAESLNPIFP